MNSTRNYDNILREAEQEFKRRGRFNLIYPYSANTVKNLFENDQTLNSMLY